MKNLLLLLLLAAAFVPVLAGCGNASKPGETNVERGAAKTIIPKEGEPAVPGTGATAIPGGGATAVGKDSAAAGLHRNLHPVPTGEQLYDRASRSVDRNHDGKADH